MRVPALATGLLALLLVAGCGGEDETTPSASGKPDTVAAEVKVSGPEPKVQPPKGAPPKTLVIRDIRRGAGPVARPGDELTTQFAAILVTGKPFESSWDAGNKPFSFHLGANESSPGWERGLRGMRQGGRRELIIPPRISSRFGTPPGSGPEDTLVYVIDLLEVTPP